MHPHHINTVTFIHSLTHQLKASLMRSLQSRCRCDIVCPLEGDVEQTDQIHLWWTVLPGLGAQNLPHDQIGDSDPDHLDGGGQTHGGSDGRLGDHQRDGRPHAGLNHGAEVGGGVGWGEREHQECFTRPALEKQTKELTAAKE